MGEKPDKDSVKGMYRCPACGASVRPRGGHDCPNRVIRWRFMADHYEKYHNPDRRCRYPFKPDPLGYCWSYATAVDARDRGEPPDAVDTLADRVCRISKCEYWQEG